MEVLQYKNYINGVWQDAISGVTTSQPNRRTSAVTKAALVIG